MPDNKKTTTKVVETSANTSKVDKLAQEIGRRISEARNGLGLSQQAVHTRSKIVDAEGLGVSRAALSLYETGTNKPGAREITLLCEVLTVSPNWLLYGSESPAKTLQPATRFMVGDDLAISARLAFAMLALNPADRDSLAHIVFSMLTGKLGDTQLSMLMTMATMMRDDINAQLLEIVGDDSSNLPLPQLIDKFIAELTEGGESNYGTLRPNLTEDELFEGAAYPPPRILK